MSDQEIDKFEDAVDSLLEPVPSSASQVQDRPTFLPVFRAPGPPLLAPSTSFSPFGLSCDHGQSSARRDRLRGLRQKMREDFSGRDGAQSCGDGDTLSLISETTSLHSWHRKVLAGPSSIVHPADSISTCALATQGGPMTADSFLYSPARANSPACVPMSPIESPQSVSSVTGPPPSHPPPPLPEIRTPPPVPPRNPSISLPKPVPTTPKQESPTDTCPAASPSSEAPPVLLSPSMEEVEGSKLPQCTTDTTTPISIPPIHSNGDIVQPTPVSAGRRRGHTKTNSLDRGLTLAKSIKTGPFPPPSQKSNSLTRGQNPPDGCDGEEDERNQQAEGVIAQLTTQLMTEHASENTLTSASSSADHLDTNGTTASTPVVQEIVTTADVHHPLQRRITSISRDARKSETIVEETESENTSPSHVQKLDAEEKTITRPDSFGPNSSCIQNLSLHTYDAQRSVSEELPLRTPRSSPLLASARPGSSSSANAVDPITRDVERRMSMKGHGHMNPESIGDDDRSDQLSPTSKVGYAKSVVKSYASAFVHGMVNKAAHVWRPSSALKTDADDTASNSDDNADPSTAETHSNRGGGALVRPKNSKKGPYDFEHLKVTQELKAEHTGAVWVVRFSVCGRLMATAGQDAIIRIWVARAHVKHFEAMRERYMKRADCTPQEMFERSMQDADAFRPPSSFDSDFTNSNPSDDEARSQTVFMPQPFAMLKGHTADVLDLSWSKNNFILSSGMDRTVKLWHITRTECLCCFQHVDFVTCVAFLPKDDRYFLSGSMDGKLRLWHIPDKKVAVWNEVQVKFITALAFVKSGKFAVVGTYNGRCYFYTADQLKYHTVVDARSTRGKNARGHKVTGLAVHGDKLLVTSNDSRVRMYDVRDMSLTCKFIGAQNEHSQIRASFSPDGKHVICGSEDKYVYIWRTSDLPSSLSVRKDRNKLWERVRTHASSVCTAVFAPKPTELLGMDGKGGHKASQSSSEREKTPNRADVIVSADLSGCIKIMVCKTKPVQPVPSSFFNGSAAPMA